METLSPLVRALSECKLLDSSQLAELTRDLQVRFPEPRSLAKELIQRRWLTPFQVNLLLQNRGKDLFLGPYILLERLGEGGMGTVFKARHQHLDRVVALKVIRKERLANPTVAKRFQREVKAAASLAHANIVLAYDADEVDRTSFLVMEYVDGFDLGRLVKEKGPLPVGLACDAARQAALGLQHAYEKGMVHRDIKPSNLLRTRAGVVKVLDMGLARVAEEDDGSSLLTQEGSVVGTPDFISPEQALDSRKIDIRSDLYSLGGTLYFLLTGQAPFPGGTALEKLLKHRLEQPTPVEKLRPQVPMRVAVIVQKLLEKKPEDRYQTPAEAAQALAACLSKAAGKEPGVQEVAAGASAVAEDVPTVAEGSQPTDDPRRLRAAQRQGRWRRRLLLGGGVLAGGVCLVLGLRFGLRSDPAGTTAPVPAKKDDPAALAWGDLQARPRGTPAELDQVRQGVLDLRRRFPGTPEARRAADLLRELRSPLDDMETGRVPLKVQAYFSQQGQTVVGVLHRGRIFSLGDPVRSVAFSPDGKVLAGGGEDGSIYLWHLPSLREQTSQSRHSDKVTCVTFSPDGKTVASCGRDETVKLWEAATGRQLASWSLSGGVVWSVAYAPDGQKLAAACNRGGVKLLDAATGKELATFRGQDRATHAAAFAPDGRTMAVGNREGVVQVCDVASVKVVQTLTGHSDGVFCLAYAPDGKTLASGSDDKTVKLWDLGAGKERSTLSAHTTAVSGLAFAPDGQTLISVSRGGTVIRWEAASGKNLQDWKLLNAAWAVAVAPDGRHTAITTGEGAILLFRARQ